LVFYVKQLNTAHRIIIGIQLMALGALSLWPALTMGSLLTAIPILGFVVVLCCVLLYMKMGARLFEHFTTDGFLYTTLGSVAVTLISSTLLLLLAEAPYIDNTIHGLSMLRYALVAGMPVGAMTWVWLSKRLGIKHIILLKAFLISFAMLSATATSQINRGKGVLEDASLTADVMEKSKDQNSIIAYMNGVAVYRYIYIPLEDEDERLNVPGQVWDAMYNNASVELSLRNGYFGYPYVETLNNVPLL
jgi:hypothetical protein